MKHVLADPKRLGYCTRTLSVSNHGQGLLFEFFVVFAFATSWLFRIGSGF
jgi:hypothetical protein